MAGLNTGGQRFAGDDGTPDPRVAAILAAYAAGQDTERTVLAALSNARLLVPLVQAAGPDDAPGSDDAPGAHDASCDHHGAKEMAFPTLIGRDGRPAVLAFTSLAALLSWRPDARPVPATADQVWGTAVADSCAVVIDVAGPVPLAVDGARLAALAAGEPPPAPQADPDVRADVAAVLAGQPAIVGAELAEGPDGTDLAVRLMFRPAGAAGTGEPALPPAVQQAAEAIVARLAGRLRRGIEISAVPVSGVRR